MSTRTALPWSPWFRIRLSLDSVASDVPRRADRRDSGAGTVTAVSLVAVVALVATTVAAAGAAQIGVARAQNAADLAALGAAAVARDDRALGRPFDERACATATDIARRNGARLTTCEVTAHGDVTVMVAVPLARGEASASARAGPRLGP